MSTTAPAGASEPGKTASLVHESPTTRVHRLHPGALGAAGQVHKQALDARRAERLRHERQVLQRLRKLPGVAQLAEGKHPAGVLALLDAGGGTLAHALGSGRPPLAELLGLALELARTVGRVHAAGVVHGDIHPGNIVLGAPWRQPVLVDFDLALLAGQAPDYRQDGIAGRLEYIAPEQTGRTGRSVDERADLYALGITFYELATGRLPFESTDPLQLIHDHLVEKPVAPAERIPSLPQAFSDIVLRLLAKEPEQRYQSANGLAHDLARLRTALAAGEPASFPLGQQDFAARLPTPARPVGRGAEMAALRGAFQAALDGGPRGALVSGAAGVGKSMLVDALRPLVKERRGWFVSGKFDAQRQDMASDGLFQCLRALGRIMLAEPETELQVLQNRLLEALGPYGCAIMAQVPELALLLGSQPDAAALVDPLSAKDRLVEATLDFLRALATPARPVVLVLDDLQWAAPLPVAAIHAVFTDPTLRGLFLVCAYRDAEIGPSHPMAAMLPRWQRLAPAPLALALRNLDATGMVALLGEMLRLEPGEAKRVAPLILAHTDGNPFDTVQLLDGLRREGALNLAESGWTWDEAAIPRHIAQGSVGKLLANRIAALPPQTRVLVDVVACLGGAVDLPLLQVAGAVPADTLLLRLEPAVRDGLLELTQEGQQVVRFSHDRVQQASLERLPADEREQLHLEVARRLAACPAFEATAAHQYLPALASIRDGAERLRVARLLRSAAGPLRPFNPSAADRMLTGAIALLTEAGTGDAELVPLQIERHGVLFSLGRLVDANALYERIARHCEDPLLLAPAACVQICSLTNQGHPKEAIALGEDVVARLGIVLPGQDQLAQMRHGAKVVFARWLEPQVVAADIERPAATAPRALAAGRLLDRMTPASFFCDPVIFARLVLAGQQLWITHGPAAEFVGLLSHVPFVCVGAWNDYRTGRTVARCVLDIAEARGWQASAAHSRFLRALGTVPWQEGPEQAAAEAHRAHQGLQESGDLQNACFTFYASLVPLADCASLERYAAEAEAALASSARTGNDHAAAAYLAHRQLARSMRGETVALGCFDDGAFDEAAHATSVAGNYIAGIHFHALRALGAAIGRDTAALVHHAETAMGMAEGGGSIYLTTLVHVVQMLALAQRAGVADGAARPECLLELDAVREWLAARAADAPSDFQHLLDWADAERGWVAGDFRAAAIAFDAAQCAAALRSRPWHRALIAERTGLFLLANGMRHGSERALAQSRHYYAAWGAPAKVRRLDAEYDFLQAAAAVAAARGDGGAADAALAGADRSIDMLGLLRASQALSSNTDLASLKTSIVGLLGSMTGATSVLLALWNAEQKQWLLSAASDCRGAAMPVEDAGRLGLLPLSAFHYAGRTLEPLVVDDAPRDDRFGCDPYFSGLARCSLLVYPILSQGAPQAMLLLENRLGAAAFSAERLDAVRLIAGQLAVSLENALLYQELEQRVQERTRELRAAQAELVATARRAGMAEIATNVLHNVGNVLNSVNVSANLVSSRLRTSKARSLTRAVQLLEAHAHDLPHFLTGDERGRLLPAYLGKVAEAIGVEQREVVAELAHLTRSVEHIKDVVATQQSHAGTSSVVEPADVGALLEDALRINALLLERYRVTVERDFAAVPQAQLDKARVLQILVNLIRNAAQAMEAAPGDRPLVLRIEPGGPGIRVLVRDQGVGIAPENLTRIFSHGFTTRRAGHGFGLHSCALAAREMGGTLTASSEGPGRGASFALELPLSPRQGPAKPHAPSR